MRIINEGCHLLGDDKVQAIIDVCGELNMQNREALGFVYLATEHNGVEVNKKNVAKSLNIAVAQVPRMLKLLEKQGLLRLSYGMTEAEICWSYFETVKEQLELGVYDDVQEALKKIYEGEKQAV